MATGHGEPPHGKFRRNVGPGFTRIYDRHAQLRICLLYTSDAADERSSVDLGGRRIIKKKKNIRHGGYSTNEEKKTKIERRQEKRQKHTN